MRALADDAAVVQNENLIGVHNRIYALRDDDERFPRIFPPNGAADGRIGRIIERAGGIVQNQNIEIPHQCARNRQALALAAGKIHTAALNLRAIALGLGGNKPVCLRRARGTDDLLVGRVRPAPAEVLLD